MVDSPVSGIRDRADKVLFCEFLDCLCHSRFIIVSAFCQLLKADALLLTDAEQKKLLSVSDAEVGQSCLKVSLGAALNRGNML